MNPLEVDLTRRDTRLRGTARPILLAIVASGALASPRAQHAESASAAQTAPQGGAPAPRSVANPLTIEAAWGQPFTPADRKRVADVVFADARIRDATRGQRVRVLSIAHDEQKATESQRLASVVLFNYTSGRATRALVTIPGGEVIEVRELRGRPAPSEEELGEATRIIRETAALKPLVDGGAQVEGGFAVEGPSGLPRSHRYLQFHLLSADRENALRTIVVDLTSGNIVLTRAGLSTGRG